MHTSKFTSFSATKNRFVFRVMPGGKGKESFMDKLQDTTLDFLGLTETFDSVDKQMDRERENLKNEVVDAQLEKQEEQVESMIQKETVKSTGGGGGKKTKKKKQSQTVERLNSIDVEKLSKDAYRQEAERVKAKSKTALKLLSFFAPKDFESKDDFEKLRYLDEIRTKKYRDIWAESEGFWGTCKNSLLWFGIKLFGKTDRGRKIFGFVDSMKMFGSKAEDIKEKLSLTAEEAREQLKGIGHLHQTLREKPELARKKIKSNYQALKQRFLRISQQEKDPVVVKQKLQQASREFMKESQNMNPKVFREEIKKGNLAGFAMRSKMIRLTINPMLEAIKERDFAQFKETIKSDEFKQVVKETLIPFVGSVNSAKRLNDENSEVPLWARRMEFGLDAACDGLFIAGVAGAASGVGAIPGLVAMGGSYSARTLGRALLKLALKSAGKLATKEGAKKTVKSTAKTAINEVKWQGLFSLGMVGAQKFYEKLYPDGVVAEMKTRAFETYLTPEQQAYAEAFGVSPEEF